MTRRVLICLLGLLSWSELPGRCQSVRIRQFCSLHDSVCFNLNRPILLDYKQNYVGITFQDTLRPADAQYAYRLSNVDFDWVQAGDRRVVTYSNLNGDNYTFQVKNVRSNSPPTQFRFDVELAFYQRWWFLPVLFLAMLVVLGIGIYLAFLVRLRQVLRMQRVRDRIARDLHDDMGSYLSSISILSQTARRNALRNPEKTQQALDSIGQTARQVIDRMGDMVWSINPSHDSMNDVLARMTDVGNTLFSDTDVVFNLSVADDVQGMSLSAEVRREFFLIYKEALTNVARYARANGIRVTLRREGHNLALTVQDNGCGFDPANPTYRNPGGGNGLRNMQARAKLIGGELTLQSAPGEGTIIRLLVAGGGAS
ncbi:sensor histidine kinase [Fibrella sp. HMF5335]|uniref:Sensor histidine kinase n=1 Tax=Fibrella rubiginis TaxID=2817060 RepID=A0A939GET6_9BACT|nr:histidine kinase [Fibrella rubiginis]MBO0935909.1 sensor histidine kinase [Fibrella rubiginis]